jgi:uncharacterized membrane protein
MKVALGKRRGHRHSAFLQALAERVADVQRQTSATVAVVLRKSSGSYRDVAYLSGAAAAWVGLLLALFLPHELHPYLIPLDLLALFGAGAFLVSRTRLRAWLTTRRRQRRQVRTAAHAAFVEEGLIHAREDRGLLIFWSRLERRMEVVADTGVLTAVPAEEWNAFVFDLRAVPRRPHAAAALLERLRELGELLARHLPAADTSRGPQLLPFGVER